MSTTVPPTRNHVKEAINQLEDKGKAKEETKTSNSNEVTEFYGYKKKKLTSSSKRPKGKRKSNIQIHWDKKKADEAREAAEAKATAETVSPMDEDKDNTKEENNEEKQGEQGWLEVATKNKTKETKSTEKNQAKEKNKIDLQNKTAWTCLITPMHRNETIKVNKAIKGILEALQQVDKNVHLTKKKRRRIPGIGNNKKRRHTKGRRRIRKLCQTNQE